MSFRSHDQSHPVDRGGDPRVKGNRQGGADKHRTTQRTWSQDHSVTEQARALAVADRFDDAVSMLRPYLRSEPKDVEARLVLAWSLLGGKHYESALAELQALAPLAPRHPQRLALLALASSLAGRHDDAVAAAGTLHQLRPQDPQMTDLLRSVTADATRARERPLREVSDRNWARLTQASVALWAVLFVTARVRLLVAGDVPAWGRAAGLVGVVITLAVWAFQFGGDARTVARELRAGLSRPMFVVALVTHVLALIGLGCTAVATTTGYPAVITAAVTAVGISALAVLGHFVLLFRRAGDNGS